MKDQPILFGLLLFVCVMFGAFLWLVSLHHCPPKQTREETLSSRFYKEKIYLPRLIEEDYTYAYDADYDIKVSKGIKERTSLYYAHKSDGTPCLEAKTVCSYDRNGNLNLLERKPGPGKNWGEERERWFFRYDDKGNKIEDGIMFSLDKISEKTIYQYDDKGRKIGWTYYEKGKLTTTAIYKYDDDRGRPGCATETTEKIYTNTFGYSDRFVYNYYKRLLAQEITYDASGLTFMDLYTYDDDDNKIEWTRREGAYWYFVLRESYEYDEKSRLIKRTIHDHYDLHAVKTYRYDEKGNMIEETSYSDVKQHRPCRRIVFQYDEKGNKTKMLWYNTIYIKEANPQSEEFLSGWTDYEYEFYPEPTPK